LFLSVQDPYGFMAHFYVVAQYVSPVLAWGFLGSDENLKEVCEFFKVQNIILHVVKVYFICRHWLRDVFCLPHAIPVHCHLTKTLSLFPILPFSCLMVTDVLLMCKRNVFIEDSLHEFCLYILTKQLKKWLGINL